MGIRRITGATPLQFSSLVGLVIVAWTGLAAIVSLEPPLSLVAGQAFLSGAIATIPAARGAKRSGHPRLSYAGIFTLSALLVATLFSNIVTGSPIGVAFVDSTLFAVPTLSAVYLYQLGLRASTVGLPETVPGMSSGQTLRNTFLGSVTLAVLLIGTLIASGFVFGMMQSATGIDGNYYSGSDDGDGQREAASVDSHSTPTQTVTPTPTPTATPTEAIPSDLTLQNVTLANHTTWFDAEYGEFDALSGTTYYPEDNPSVYFEVSGVGYEKTGQNQYRVDYEYSVTLRDIQGGDSNTTTRTVQEVLTRRGLRHLWHGESYYIYYVFTQRSSYPYEFEIVVEDNISGQKTSKTVAFEYVPED